jgi:hypothetical protein
MYADDLMLVSASVLQLQIMLDVCSSAGIELGIEFNSKKSCCMMIGPNLYKPVDMYLNGVTIAWVDKVKYLGVVLCARNKFSVDMSEIRRNFFMLVNSILFHCKGTSELVKLELLEKHCLPILLYSVEVLDLGNAEIRNLNVWWNSIYRKIFGFQKWESVKQLICFLGRIDIVYMVNLRHILFLKNIAVSYNGVMREMFEVVSIGGELLKACSKLNIRYKVSCANIRKQFHDNFKAHYLL